MLQKVSAFCEGSLKEFGATDSPKQVLIACLRPQCKYFIYLEPNGSGSCIMSRFLLNTASGLRSRKISSCSTSPEEERTQIMLSCRYSDMPVFQLPTFADSPRDAVPFRTSRTLTSQNSGHFAQRWHRGAVSVAAASA